MCKHSSILFFSACLSLFEFSSAECVWAEGLGVGEFVQVCVCICVCAVSID